MRRSDKEIRDLAEVEEILRRASVLRIAMVDETGLPYIVPMNFGYRDRTIYLHSALAGRKIDLIKRNGRVCFEAEGDTALLPAEEACEWSMSFESVIGWGQAELVLEEAQKLEALHIIMEKYSKRTWSFPPAAVKRMAVIRIVIDSMTGKRSPV